MNVHYQTKIPAAHGSADAGAAGEVFRRMEGIQPGLRFTSRSITSLPGLGSYEYAAAWRLPVGQRCSPLPIDAHTFPAIITIIQRYSPDSIEHLWKSMEFLWNYGDSLEWWSVRARLAWPNRVFRSETRIWRLTSRLVARRSGHSA
jgi:hypothetical protein